MQQYMVEIILPAPAAQEYLQLIPQQRQFIEGMFKRGIIISYTLALNRSKLWVIFFRENPNDVELLIQKFPIAEFIRYTINEVAFHNGVSTMLPSLSLN